MQNIRHTTSSKIQVSRQSDRMPTVSASSVIPPKNQSTAKSRATEAMDSSSIRGVFGWSTVDGVCIPFLMRNNQKYVSVRMVEMKLLSKYPSAYPEELKDRPPLVSQFITVNEAKLLNEINGKHCSFEYGRQGFTVQDLIVSLTDFQEFYNIVKRNFPDGTPAAAAGSSAAAAAVAKIDGGWIQVNNTIVPYLIRKGIKFVPLSVIRYGANLLNNVQVAGLACTDQDISYLNQTCKKAGLEFTFTKESTKLIEINLIPTLSEVKPIMNELPKADPFGGAKYKAEIDVDPNLPFYNLPQPYPPTVKKHSTARNASLSSPPAAAAAAAAAAVSAAASVPVPLSSIAGPTPRIPPRIETSVGADRFIPPGYTILPPVLSTNASAPVIKSLSIPCSSSNAPFPKQSRGLGPGPQQKAATNRSNSYRPSVPSAAHQKLPKHSALPPYPHQPKAKSRPGSPRGRSSPAAKNADYQGALDLSKPNSSAKVLSRDQKLAQRNPVIKASLNSSAMLKHGAMDVTEKAPSASNKDSNVKISTNPKTGVSKMIHGSGNIIQLRNGKTITLHTTSFHGKGITSIGKDGDAFALLESLNRMFFPSWNLNYFLHILTKQFNLVIKELTQEEEQAFIAHYELRINKLRFPKLVSLSQIDLHMNQLKLLFSSSTDAGDAKEESPGDVKSRSDNYADSMFSQAPPSSRPSSVGSYCSSANSPPLAKSENVQRTTESPLVKMEHSGVSCLPQDTNNNTGLDGEGSMNHRFACEALKHFIGSKRAASFESASPSVSPPPSKRQRQSTGKLEDIMNKLKKAQMTPAGSCKHVEEDLNHANADDEIQKTSDRDEKMDISETSKVDEQPEQTLGMKLNQNARAKSASEPLLHSVDAILSPRRRRSCSPKSPYNPYSDMSSYFSGYKAHLESGFMNVPDEKRFEFPHDPEDSGISLQPTDSRSGDALNGLPATVISNRSSYAVNDVFAAFSFPESSQVENEGRPSLRADTCSEPLSESDIISKKSETHSSTEKDIVPEESSVVKSPKSYHQSEPMTTSDTDDLTVIHKEEPQELSKACIKPDEITEISRSTAASSVEANPSLQTSGLQETISEIPCSKFEQPTDSLNSTSQTDSIFSMAESSCIPGDNSVTEPTNMECSSVVSDSMNSMARTAMNEEDRKVDTNTLRESCREVEGSNATESTENVGESAIDDEDINGRPSYFAESDGNVEAAAVTESGDSIAAREKEEEQSNARSSTETKADSSITVSTVTESGGTVRERTVPEANISIIASTVIESDSNVRASTVTETNSSIRPSTVTDSDNIARASVMTEVDSSVNVKLTESDNSVRVSTATEVDSNVTPSTVTEDKGKASTVTEDYDDAEEASGADSGDSCRVTDEFLSSQGRDSLTLPENASVNCPEEDHAIALGSHDGNSSILELACSDVSNDNVAEVNYVNDQAFHREEDEPNEYDSASNEALNTKPCQADTQSEHSNLANDDNVPNEISTAVSRKVLESDLIPNASNSPFETECNLPVSMDTNEEACLLSSTENENESTYTTEKLESIFNENIAQEDIGDVENGMTSSTCSETSLRQVDNASVSESLKSNSDLGKPESVASLMLDVIDGSDENSDSKVCSANDSKGSEMEVDEPVKDNCKILTDGTIASSALIDRAGVMDGNTSAGETSAKVVEPCKAVTQATFDTVDTTANPETEVANEQDSLASEGRESESSSSTPFDVSIKGTLTLETVPRIDSKTTDHTSAGISVLKEDQIPEKSECNGVHSEIDRTLDVNCDSVNTL